MPILTCIAPLTDSATLCGAPSATTRTVEGLVCALCAAHAAELDAERNARRRLRRALVPGERRYLTPPTPPPLPAAKATRPSS